MTGRHRGVRPRDTRHRRTRPARIPATLAVTAGNVALLFIATANGAVAARSLGPTLRGEFIASQSWAATTGVGLTFGITQAIVIDRAEASRLRAPLLAHTVLTLGGGLVLFGLFVALGLQPWLTTAGVLGAACMTAGTVATSHATGMAQRQGRMSGAFQAVRIVPALAGSAATVPLVLGGRHDPNLWLVVLGATSAAIALGQLATCGFGPAPAASPWTRVRRLLPPRGFAATARRAYVSVIGAQVIYRLDVLVIAVCLASREVAFYGVATAVAGGCAAVAQSTGMVMFSRLRGASPESSRRLVCQGTALSLTVAAAIAVPLALLAPLCIRAIYGAEFAPAVGATRVLLLASIPLAADYLLIHALLGLGAPRAVTKVQAPVAALTILLLAAAVRRGDLVGVAAVSAVTYTFSALLLFSAVLRLTTGGTARPVTGTSPGAVPSAGVPSAVDGAPRIPRQRQRDVDSPRPVADRSIRTRPITTILDQEDT
ncbi:lipopolysaccharide biosynthesis protein [Parafrankia discariae]|uniref:lipopolysaccharide biosynthesis protein n=1 Tax=Parafrankia discariae TaxID=365528 RepID=UPI0003626A5C|nr:hypothetical protein [Parafrankia discariae]